MTRILVVDDDPYISNLIRILMTGEGVHISVAQSAEEARGALSFATPTLILLDLEGVQGAELSQELTVPFVLLTGSTDLRVIKRITALDQALGLIRKPIDANTFTSAVMAYVRTAQRIENTSTAGTERAVGYIMHAFNCSDADARKRMARLGPDLDASAAVMMAGHVMSVLEGD